MSSQKEGFRPPVLPALPKRGEGVPMDEGPRKSDKPSQGTAALSAQSKCEPGSVNARIIEAVRLEDIPLMLRALRDADARAISNLGPALLLACTSNFLPGAELLLSAGADVNYQKDLFGVTPLMVACATGNFALVNLMISYRADMGLWDAGGRTALRIACEMGFTDIEALLRKHGATA